MLAADSEVEVGLHATSLCLGDFHQSARTISVERGERVVLKNALVEVGVDELAVVVAAEAERRLREVVRAEAEEVGDGSDLVGRKSRARELDHRANLEREGSSAVLVDGGDDGLRLGANLLDFLVCDDVRNHDAHVVLHAFLVELGSRAGNRLNLHLVDFRISDCEAASAVSEHRVVLVKGGNLRDEGSFVHAKLCRKGSCSSVALRLNELVERRVEEADGDRASFHRLDDFVEVLLLVRKNLREVLFSLLGRVRDNHFLERGEFWLVEEHVLGAAKTDSHSAEAERVLRILRRVSVREDVESLDGLSARGRAYGSIADFISPAEERLEVA